MTKQQAIAIFGSGAALGRAVGLTRGRISQWPPELSQRETDLVVGAAVRHGLGNHVPCECVATHSEAPADEPAAV